MSYWTHIRGMITVEPLGRAQTEKRYILETVLAHLPIVTGSEGDMSVHIIQRDGYNESVSCDEFGNRTNNLRDDYGFHDRELGFMRMQSMYFLVVEADLRDVHFQKALRMLSKWLCRLAKRVIVQEILIQINGNWYLFGIDETMLITNPEPYHDMFEFDNNWCDFLMWNGKDIMTEQEIKDNLGRCKCGAIVQSEQWRMCPRCGTRFIERDRYDPEKENYIPNNLR